jgi:hypothetical protein
LRRGSQNPAGAAGERAVGRAGAGVPGVRSRLKPLLVSGHSAPRALCLPTDHRRRCGKSSRS